MSNDALSAARERLLALKSRSDAGTLAPSDYERERRAVERALGEAVVASAPGSDVARPSRRLLAGLFVLVVGIAVVGYAMTGKPSMTGLAAASKPQPVDAAALAADPSASGGAGASGDPRQAGLQQIAAMVDSLAARMKERPDDGEGWTMLARSYTVLGRFGEAVPAYAKAAALQPSNAGLLADYADAVAAQKGTVGNPETLALIDRALAADPKHPKALALAGTAAYDRGDFAGAVARWQKIADSLPPGSELLAQVQASISEAKERVGGAAAPTASATVSPAAADKGASAAAADVSAVAGTVSLDPSLAAKAAPGDTVFVFARAAEGPRMPLAVKRATVADLPLTFRLDDSMAMSPAAKLSGASSVIVGARISKSGNAMPQPGDLSGESKPVQPGTGGIAVRIGEVASPR